MPRLFLLLLIFSFPAHAQKCPWEVLLEKAQNSKNDPWELFRLYGPEPSFSTTDFYSLSDLTPDLKVEAKMYLGTKVFDSSTPLSTVIFSLEVE